MRDHALRPVRTDAAARGRRAWAWAVAALLATMALPTAASADPSALLPSHGTTLSLRTENWGATPDGRWVGLLGWDTALRDSRSGLQLGADLGAAWSGGPTPSGTPGIAAAARLGGVFNLYGWNAFWPGEVIFTSEAELRYDAEHPWLRGARFTPRLGLRMLCGFATTFVFRLDLDVAPVVYGEARSGDLGHLWSARARAFFGVQRAQIFATYERLADRTHGGSLSRFVAGLQFGFGGRG